MPPEHTQPPYSLWQLVLYFLKLGTWGFGGPIALVGYMKRDLVEERQWISESDYKEGLSLAQLAPGPLAEQLAIYMGYVHYGVLGATLTGLIFPLPAFLMVLALGWAYTLYGGLPWMQAIFYTVGATVIGIIANSSYKLTVKTIGKDWLFWGIYIVSAAVTVITESEKISLILAAGVLVWLVKAPPKWRIGQRLSSFAFTPMLAILAIPTATAGTLWNIFIFFGKAGAFVFGSGLAIVPFLYGGLVNELQWLNSEQFVDAVAVAMITPGPIVITVGFIGFLVAGLAGAVVATLATFLPCYLFTIIPAPYFKKHGKQPGVAAFVEGVTVAAIGAITGAVVVLGQRSLVDIPTIVIAAITLVLLLIFKKKLPEPLIVLVSACLGLVIYPLTH
ncbi:MAG TPA: chromate transporter [Cyanobacteria bacterium UBA11370]|nr:chromate transporter [Cyanobacteria bacterium UBA11370]HBY75601.1 chromate transporter [Cyanobacteria bacterium UBA11148]